MGIVGPTSSIVRHVDNVGPILGSFAMWTASCYTVAGKPFSGHVARTRHLKARPVVEGQS
ncbi:hypothetical protein TorRG33x02_155400 [Trema orientale]|uniref:Uncharacterized protein n=1 Tax=Trema orientale TaxID=63057 RepID=A0A2P5ET05_TREOI|nr:hypothetical protein TorRG33x02_155400 [Trema orientale]